jgi:hypothetical protein
MCVPTPERSCRVHFMHLFEEHGACMKPVRKRHPACCLFSKSGSGSKRDGRGFDPDSDFDSDESGVWLRLFGLAVSFVVIIFFDEFNRMVSVQANPQQS